MYKVREVFIWKPNRRLDDFLKKIGGKLAVGEPIKRLGEI
jgi:hypothetical protein